MVTNKTVSVVICDSCKNYRKKGTSHMETFYHCVFDKPKMIRICMEEIKKSTPSVDEVLLSGECKKFKSKNK